MSRFGRRALAAAGLALAALAAAGAEPSEPPVVEKIPPRPADAISGSEFARRTTGVSGPERQRAAVQELERGNLPESLRRLAPVRVAHETADGAPVEIVLWVMPDYLAIGSDEDSLRIPLNHPSAARVARGFGFVLPTRKLVDEIFDRAAVKLAPKPLPPGPRMRSSEYYLRHHRLIEEQLAGEPRGRLTAGHKKDVVLTNRLKGRRDRIAIYGWHRPTGAPIQPLSTVHDVRYADYSHGVRLVWGLASVDGEERPLTQLLADPRLAPALTYEGEIRGSAELMREPGS